MMLILHGLDRFTEQDLESWRAYMTPQRLEKIDALRFFPDKIASACAFMLLRYALGYNYHVHNPTFAFTETGKPYFPNRENFCFSISHDRKGVCVGICGYGEPIGVDAQAVFPYEQGLAERILSEVELKNAEKKDPSYLTRVWGLKEAYGKMLGDGVYAHLKNTKMDRADHDGIFGYDGEDGEIYFLYSRLIDDVVYSCSHTTYVKIIQITPEQLRDAVGKLCTYERGVILDQELFEMARTDDLDENDEGGEN